MNTSHPTHDQSGRSSPASVDHHSMAVKADQPLRIEPSVDRHPTVQTVPTHEPTTSPPSGKPPKRKPCTCAAYRWPHRPSGGLCRWPEPPLSRHPTPAGTNRPTGLRRRGLRKSIMREYGLHPIRDREVIERLLPGLYESVARGELP